MFRFVHMPNATIYADPSHIDVAMICFFGMPNELLYSCLKTKSKT
jgi:hypothetical protein